MPRSRFANSFMFTLLSVMVIINQYQFVCWAVTSFLFVLFSHTLTPPTHMSLLIVSLFAPLTLSRMLMAEAMPTMPTPTTVTLFLLPTGSSFITWLISFSLVDICVKRHRRRVRAKQIEQWWCWGWRRGHWMQGLNWRMVYIPRRKRGEGGERKKARKPLLCDECESGCISTNKTT